MTDATAAGTEAPTRYGKGRHPNALAALAKHRHEPWTKATRPDPHERRRVVKDAPDALQRMVERLAKPVPPGSCACGCRHRINPSFAVVVPSIGAAVNMQHATQALANWMQRAREELAKLPDR